MRKSNLNDRAEEYSLTTRPHRYRAVGLLPVCLFAIASLVLATDLRATEPLESSTNVLAVKPNVLFIAVDDLRPELACYGKEHIHSPNIDRLAEQGVLFERAFCMVPTCGASRASLLTGLRPRRDRFVSYQTVADKDAPDAVTMNTHFKNQGYRTVSLGKVFHNAKDNASGWSDPVWRPTTTPTYRRPENIALHAERQKLPGKNRGPAWESADVEDNQYADGVIAEEAIARLNELKENDKPFFMAVGFLKPHLPFIAPKKYWDLYDHNEISLPENYEPPENAPAESIHNSGELRTYSGIPRKGKVSDEAAKNLIHGYYACVSYTDAQIGKVLETVDQLGLSDNTIVVLWGDHGWNLGEHTLWCKHSCYETSMQIPLIVKAPGIAGGQRRTQLVESVDLYPTLCELAGLPTPIQLTQVENSSKASVGETSPIGESLVALLKDPNAKIDSTAIGRFQNGDTIRSDQFRFTRYTNKSDQQTSRMLYDHQSDPRENQNVEHQKSKVADELSDRLQSLLRTLK